MFGIYPPIELILSWSEQARERLERVRRQRERIAEDERARRNRQRSQTPKLESRVERNVERKVS
jgi:hypothetical protein